jgi:histidinol-phosphate phosphatase family protein
VRLQAGNADDALMASLHGRGWRAAAEVPKGRRRRHALTAATGALAVGAALARCRPVARGATATWLAATTHFAWERIAPGPRTPREVLLMGATSAAIPPAATAHWLRGTWRHRGGGARRAHAVLFDRDGTLVRDVPYNGDPARVEPMTGARDALDRLRRAGVAIGVITNQSGVGRGLLDLDAVSAVNRRVEEVLGPISTWAVCPHSPDERCQCRKPGPGLIHRAAADLGVAAAECAVVGDIGSDVEAALSAGARAVLVPTAVTRPEEVRAAPVVARDLRDAVDAVLRGRA